MIMDFLVCQCGLLGLHVHKLLEGIKDENEAISEARDIALHTKEGAKVGLFTRDGRAICGWKVMEDGKLRNEPIEEIQFKCGVDSGTFEFVKKHAYKHPKSRNDRNTV